MPQNAGKLLNTALYAWRRNSWMVDPRFHLVPYHKAPIDRPVFLLGNQGGGLTLIARMLRRSPHVVSISGGADYWAGADEMQKAYMWYLPPTLRLGGKYNRGEPHHPVFTPPRGWTYASNDLFSFYRRTAEDAAPEPSRKLRQVLGYSLHRFGPRDRTGRFVDKSQVLTVKMGFVNELLKDSNPHFLLVTRNPYVSCIRAARKPKDMQRYASILSFEERVEITSQHWANAMSAVLEDRSEVEHFHWIRFEDMLHNPKEKLKEICEFTEIAFDGDMLPSEHHAIPRGSRYRDRWFPLRTEVNRQYSDDMSSEFLDIVERHCADLAADFGYSRP